MVFLGLRRAKGIDLEAFREKCGRDFDDFADNRKIAGFIDRGLLRFEGPFLRPTVKGLLVADAMAAAII